MGVKVIPDLLALYGRVRKGRSQDTKCELWKDAMASNEPSKKCRVGIKTDSLLTDLSNYSVSKNTDLFSLTVF